MDLETPLHTALSLHSLDHEREDDEDVFGPVGSPTLVQPELTGRRIREF
jgi:hypothetical protein